MISGYDFDFEAFMKVTRSKFAVPRGQAIAQLRLRSKLLMATIETPVFGSDEWRALQERY